MNREMKLFVFNQSNRKTYILSDQDVHEWVRRWRYLFGHIPRNADKLATLEDINKEFPATAEERTHELVPLTNLAHCRDTHLIPKKIEKPREAY